MKMKRLRRPAARISAAFALCAAVLTLPAAAAERPKIRIVTTVYPLTEFARAVAGDRGEARLLLPPGAEVHTWQPRAGDVLGLSGCDLFIKVGLGLEPWLDGLLKGLTPASLRV